MYLAVIFAATYALCHFGKGKGKNFQKISVIIAARNEEDYLSLLFDSLAALSYPKDKYEIIIVNDRSTDRTLELLTACKHVPNLKVIDWQSTQDGLVGKKAALMQGISAASNDILAFTDADCQVPPLWLQIISQAFEEDVDYVLGHAIVKRDPRDWTFRPKNFEWGIYYSLAAAGMHFRHPITSIACNMSYRKSAFLAAGGFGGIGHLHSGDDDLLLMKMMPYLRRAVYITDPAVRVVTYEGHDLVKRYHTNIRRASKLRYFPLWLQGLGVFVFLYFLLFYLSLFGLIWGAGCTFLIPALIIKTGAELCLVFTHFIKVKLPWLGTLYPVQLLLFPAQFIFYALRGSLGKYRWK